MITILYGHSEVLVVVVEHEEEGTIVGGQCRDGSEAIVGKLLFHGYDNTLGAKEVQLEVVGHRPVISVGNRSTQTNT